MKTQQSKIYSMLYIRGSKKEVCSSIGLPQKIWNSQIKKNLISKGIRKRRINKTKVRKKKEIIKIRGEINEIEYIETKKANSLKKEKNMMWERLKAKREEDGRGWNG